MNTQHYSSWTNTRQMDKSQFFPLYFLNRTWDNVFYVADTSSNMHGTLKNSPYGQKKIVCFSDFFYAHRRTNWDSKFAVSDKKKNSGALVVVIGVVWVLWLVLFGCFVGCWCCCCVSCWCVVIIVLFCSYYCGSGIFFLVITWWLLWWLMWLLLWWLLWLWMLWLL